LRRTALRLVVLGHALGLCAVAWAQELPGLEDSSRLLQGFSPEVSLYYSRSVADESTSEFSHYTGALLGLGYAVTPTLGLKASLSIDRALGAPIERFAASNTSLSATRSYALPSVGTLAPSLFVKLATNQDDVRFLSYEGSLGAGLALSNLKVFTFGQHHALGGVFGLSAARNLYEYDANLAGGLSRLWTFGWIASLRYTFYERLTLGLDLKDTLAWFSAGKRDSERYELAGSIGFKATDELFLTLATVTADRTFQYDQVTWNVSLYRTERTMFVFSIAYLPKFKS